MWKFILCSFLSFAAFSQEPDFHFKGLSFTLDSVEAGSEVRKFQGLLASEKNPVKGWYGLKKGFRGRFGMYVPPLMEKLGLAELTHEAKNNRMRAK